MHLWQFQTKKIPFVLSLLTNCEYFRSKHFKLWSLFAIYSVSTHTLHFWYRIFKWAYHQPQLMDWYHTSGLVNTVKRIFSHTRKSGWSWTEEENMRYYRALEHARKIHLIGQICTKNRKIHGKKSESYSISFEFRENQKS